MTYFRPFFNAAIGEWIECLAIAERNDSELVRFNLRSVPGGAITEQFHPGQEDRLTIPQLRTDWRKPPAIVRKPRWLTTTRPTSPAAFHATSTWEKK